MLAEVVVPVDGHAAEVAHLGPAAAGHAVAALGLDEAGPALVALSDASSSHFLFSEKRRRDWRAQGSVAAMHLFLPPCDCRALPGVFSE